MKDNLKYDPEDIESLLMHKQFHELYEEERNFVLQHVEGEEEYESLRRTLFELHDASNNEDLLEPDPAIKKELMSLFVTERKSRFTIWLNSLFAQTNIEWYKRPAFALSFATACIAIVVVVIFNRNNNQEMAANREADSTPTTEEQITNDSTIESARLFAERLESESFPPAPKAGFTTIVDANIEEVENDMPAPANEPSQIVTEEEMIGDLTTADADDGSLSKIADKKNKNEDEELVIKNSETVVSSSKASKDRVIYEDLQAPEAEKISTKAVTIESVSTICNAPATTSYNLTTSGEYTNGTSDLFTFVPVTPNSTSAAEVKDILDLLYTAK
jgi:hypothetical protein